MVTVNKKIAANTGTATFELLGLSTDTKPVGKFSGYTVGENSVFLELDTGTLYYFTGGAWTELGESGSGGDTYETVAEIAVGQMVAQGGMYFADNVALDLSGVSADDALYFNSEEYPLTRMENEGIVIYGYNFTGSGISGTPAYGIVINPTDGNSIVSDTNALENTTVKILKKASA